MRPRPRVLVVICSEVVGGAERYAVRVALDAAAEMEVVVACRCSTQMAPLVGQLRAEGIRVLRLPRGRRLRGFAGFLVLCRLLSPDVVHLALGWPDAATEIQTALALLNRRSVVVYQLVPAAEEIDLEHRWLYRWSHRRRQRWVSVSRYGQSMIAEIMGVPASEITVIHNDAPVVQQPDEATRATLRHRLRAGLGLVDDAPIVVSVGRLEPVKGHDVLVDAAARMVVEHSQLAVLIAGVGSSHDALQRQIQARGLGATVRLLGDRTPDQVAELLAGADAFAFPSRAEGFPLALAEALALGVPAVATRFGGAGEIVEDGVTGRLVELDDDGALAAELTAILDDPDGARRRLRAGLAQVQATPSMLDETRALLREVAVGAGRANRSAAG